MTPDELIVTRSRGVGVIELNRPPNNSFDAEVVRAIADQVDAFGADGDTRCIVICSVGKHFCAGADFSGERANAPLRPVAAGIYAQAERLFHSPLPIVAAVQGAAVGGGLGLACMADFRVATPASRFVANFSRLGFHQGFGLTVTLPLIVGAQHALEMLITGASVDGTRAAEIGLADRLVDPADLRERALELAGQIAGAAPLAVSAIRRTMRPDLAERVHEAIAHELEEQDRLSRTADWKEGIAASNERREPVFRGH